MKGLCAFCACVVLMLSCTGCLSEQRQEVELYNANTAATISLYEMTSDVISGKEIELVQGIVSGALPEEWCSDTLDYASLTSEIAKYRNDLIASEPLIQYTELFTSLGANSVTQIIRCDIQGTAFLFEVLWVNCKIDMINMEVLTDVD